MKRQHRILIVVLIFAFGAVAVSVFWWLYGRGTAPEIAAAPPIVAASSAPAMLAAASAPAILYPIEVVETTEGPVDAAATLSELFGAQTVASLFAPDAFAAHVVATVDNLGRAAASPRVWPLKPTAGRFTVETRAGATFVGADNGRRYEPFLIAVESVDMRRLVQAYKRFYPQLQKEYESLGYPNGYFNDRLVAVLDSMLAAPDPPAPLEVRLPNTESQTVPTRPWILYEFADPRLAALPAGQKVLLRMGPANERRLKARLAEFRKLVAPG